MKKNYALFSILFCMVAMTAAAQPSYRIYNDAKVKITAADALQTANRYIADKNMGFCCRSDFWISAPAWEGSIRCLPFLYLFNVAGIHIIYLSLIHI